MNREGTVIGERWTAHSGSGMAELVTWLCNITGTEPAALAIAIETRTSNGRTSALRVKVISIVERKR